MKLTELLKKEEITFSFEFFPPKDRITAVEFGINVGQLIKLDPSFVTVTYGAGGTTQDMTFKIVDFFQNKLGLPCMSHYTCVNATREKVKNDILQLQEMNIENLMLLRGDPPKGETVFVPEKDGFKYGNELISFVNQLGDFSIGAAAYPEKHVEASSLENDIQNMKKKVDAGADFLVTQMFFVNNNYFSFVEKARAKGIKQRIIPGIIPITNYNQVKRFAELSGAILPESLIERLESHRDNAKKIHDIGIEFAVNQCVDLLKRGAPGIHFYTLNKSRAAVEIFEAVSAELKKVFRRYL